MDSIQKPNIQLNLAHVDRNWNRQIINNHLPIHTIVFSRAARHPKSIEKCLMGNETNLRADRNQYLRQPLQDTISKVIALGSASALLLYDPVFIVSWRQLATTLQHPTLPLLLLLLMLLPTMLTYSWVLQVFHVGARQQQRSSKKYCSRGRLASKTLDSWPWLMIIASVWSISTSSWSRNCSLAGFNGK